jgi:hypothetical protein
MSKIRQSKTISEIKEEAKRLKELLDSTPKREGKNKAPVNLFLDKDVTMRFRFYCKLKGWNISQAVENLMLTAAKQDISDEVFKQLKEYESLPASIENITEQYNTKKKTNKKI